MRLPDVKLEHIIVKLEHIIAKNSDIHDHIEEHHENETRKIKRKQYTQWISYS